ncbi:hypothetical protein JTE90_014735 [Oedothorax gibbosus]|uniref:Anticodon-binding domain-containing protein n=1 Tax=Oedothorax gibbosus TaxID=931172 RepID=A0AAV6UR32_9ARAC|nr:hypothetical protein JTE90_014735 [Oedothorax gibbosus]
MQPKILTDSFKRLIQVCNKNNFLCIKQLDGNKSSIQYGPLGSLLKRNILNEWICSHLNATDVNVFPLEILYPREKVFNASFETSDQSSAADIFSNYHTFSSFGQRLPVGFAVYGPCVNENSEKNNNPTSVSDDDFLRGLQAWTRLSVIFLCPVKNSMNWFYHWSKQRYLWWRKYSTIPSKFSMSDVTASANGDHHLSIMLEFPWGKFHLETVTLRKNGATLNNSSVENNNVESAVLTCETELDLAVIAYLSNSFSEKWRGGETKNVLQLHFKLAPYKVCLFLEASDIESLKKLETLKSHLTKELKDSSISLFSSPVLEHSSSISTSFDRLDEMGVPYIIVLNEKSLLTGIAGLRNRDTTLQEQVHIAELTPKLVKYLKIRT